MRLKEVTRNMMVLWLLLMGAIATIQADDDFSPTNPPEPYANFKVEVSSDQGYVSGAGLYQQGTQVYISTSSYSENYTFAYWTLDGEKYSEESSFYYTIGEKNVSFVAVYEFTPVNPSEPQVYNAYRLYLQPDPEGCCSFNRTSGAKAEAGSSVYLYAYANQGYVFKGWYVGDELQSNEMSFYYTMPTENTTLTAKFVYSPDNPSEPEVIMPTFENESMTLTANDGYSYYGTFSNNAVTFFPNDVMVKAVDVTDGKLALVDLKLSTTTIDGNDVKGFFVPANTGVMIKATQADVAYYTVDGKDVDDLAVNGLVAVLEDGTFTAEEGYNYYKLTYGDTSTNTDLGFHFGADDGAAFAVSAGQAYLKVYGASAQDYTFATDTIHAVTGTLYGTDGTANQQTIVLDIEAQHVAMVNTSAIPKYTSFSIQPNEFVVLDKKKDEFGDLFASMGNNIITKDGYANQVKLSDMVSFCMPACFGSNGNINANVAVYSRSMSNKWGTLCLPYAIIVDDNSTCKFYSITDIGSESLSVERVSGTIPAGTPILVYCTGNGQIDMNTNNATLVAQPISDTYMTGTFSETTVRTEHGNYIISNNRFWSVDELLTNDAVTNVKLKGFRSYISEATSNAKVFKFVIDDTNGIDMVEGLNSGDTEYYDMQGRKVETPQRGIIIVRSGKDVKKIIVR